MKEISVDGRNLKYKITISEGEYGYFFHETHFFEGTVKKKRKKYLIFGPTIEKEVPNLIFKIYKNIENPKISKEECKNIILKELLIYDRKKEIEKGNLV